MPNRPTKTTIHLESYLTTDRSVILKQIDELYRGEYINAGEAAALVRKHTDFIRVEVRHDRS